MTLGEGGFIATDKGAMRKSLSSFRDWGRACYCNTGKPGCVVSDTACGDRLQPWLPDLPEFNYDHRYVFDEIGYNLKPIELQAAIGLEQIKKLPVLDEARRENFRKLLKVFKPYEKYFHLPERTENSDPNWFAFLLTIKEESPFNRNDFVSFLEKNKIQTRSYFSGNIMYHPGYMHLRDDYTDLRNTFKNAHLVTTNSFFLGTFIGMTEQKISYIKKIVDTFFKELQ
jgi:CDP-6-deoxy-D-xylo-4-hexulose-3-dehydrase